MSALYPIVDITQSKRAEGRSACAHFALAKERSRGIFRARKILPSCIAYAVLHWSFSRFGVSSCSRRLDILEKSGVISGYHARVSHKALDYKMMVIVHISLSGQFAKTLAEFEAAVKRVPNVLVCYLMSGEYDYILRVACKDLEDYERIHRDWLSALPHVVKINSSFALREIIDRPNLAAV